MELRGSDIIVRTLIEQGSRTVFGYPGGTVLDIYDSLYKYRDEINHILVSHEQHAAHAADGYARVTGRPGVCIATSGPGCTNLVTGIATAFLDSVPLIAITGNVPTRQIGTDSFQEIDITGITLPITKHNYFVNRIEDLADTVREAFRLATTGRPGPILIDVAKDVLVDTCEFEALEIDHSAWLDCEPGEYLYPEGVFAASDEEVAAAAECINDAARPYIYFGGGAVASGAQAEICELAELIDAPIGCSLMGISGLSSDIDRFLGMEGMHGSYASTMAMRDADVIIALGVRFNDRSTGNRARFARKAQIVHIDIDDSELSKNLVDTCDLHGDVRCTLQKLLGSLKRVSHDEWREHVERLREEGAACADTREGLTPRNIMCELDSWIGPETPVVTDVGQHQMWAAQYLTFERPRMFVTSGGLGTMGFGMGAAIGAWFGTGRRPVLIIGDGGMGMCLGELATAVTQRVPMLIFLVNNSSLGMVRQMQSLYYDRRYSGTDLSARKTNYLELVRAFGADGVRVDSLEGLHDALEDYFVEGERGPGPYLVEVVVDPEELVLPAMPPGGSIADIVTKVGD